MQYIKVQARPTKAAFTLKPFSSLTAPIIVPTPGAITYKTKQTRAIFEGISH